jgi:hypothetical protein
MSDTNKAFENELPLGDFSVKASLLVLNTLTNKGSSGNVELLLRRIPTGGIVQEFCRHLIQLPPKHHHHGTLRRRFDVSPRFNACGGIQRGWPRVLLR